jgi:hypothetical protein
MSALIVLAGVGCLTIVTAIVFAAITIGIKKGDRRHLVNAPRSNSYAFARCLLVGVRHPAQKQKAGE